MIAVGAEERLFEVAAVEGGEGPPEPAGVVKTFRGYDQSQLWLLPPSIDDWLPVDHLARFVSDLVEEALDLGPFLGAHSEARGAPPFDPRLLLKLIVYGYSTGVTSSRAIERRCQTDVAFRFLSAGVVPDYRSIARFRRRHLAALRVLFVQGVRLAGRAGLVRLGRVAVDGTKVRASASRHKAMSYARMGPAVDALERQIEELLAEAERVDAEEDARPGDRRADQLPAELARRESRLAKIRKAKADLEAEAAERAAGRAAERTRRRGGDPDTVEAAAAEAAAGSVPKPTAQRGFTDPDSRIMRTSEGGFAHCYNAQAAVDDASQIVVGAALTNTAPDVGHLLDVVDDAARVAGGVPRQVVADAGYWDDDNVRGLSERGVEAFIATGRQRRGEPEPLPPRGRIPAAATPKQRMARTLRTKRGKAVYARRKAIVEPVFGQMAVRQDAKRLRLRGLAGAAGEWFLHQFCHNAHKLHAAGGLALITA
jgi:transposase